MAITITLLKVNNAVVRTKLVDSDILPAPLNDTTLLDPTGANPIVDGEWFKWSSDGETVERALDVVADQQANADPCWMCITGAGRSDTQVLGRIDLIYSGGFEVDTLLFDGAGTYAVGDELVVGNVTIQAMEKAGLKNRLHANDLKVGYVTKAPVDNNDKLRAKCVAF